MKNRNLLATILSVFALSAHAQVDDVSVTIAPTIGYNWFDSKSTVENGSMWGIQAGFGFGRVIELRGIYERSLNLKQHFGQYEGDIQNHFPDFNFAEQTIDVKRVGGEFKTNIPARRFAPYIILGTGVQTFERSLESGAEYKSENLYGSGGLGFKFNMGARTTFNIEGRGIVYNMNPGSLLYNEGGSSSFDEWINSQNPHTMYNWSVMAGLQFYFGGRNDGELSPTDVAYLKRFSSGLSGTKVTLSPAGSYIQFDENSPYRNTYMAGGMLGVELTDFVGLRGYYYQATQDEKASLDFDKLAMYGADFVGKLNVPRGIVPYISIGGGYLRVQDDYQGKPILPAIDGDPILSQEANSGYFAKGGLGVEIPLSRYVHVFGAANLLYTMNDGTADLAQIRNTSELNKHAMYDVGLRLNFGRRASTAQPRSSTAETSSPQERVAYDGQVQALEAELKTAYENNDTERAIEIMEEKKTIDSLQQTGPAKSGLIRLTPAELESLIDRVLNGMEARDTLTIEQRLERLERSYLPVYNPYQPARPALYDTVTPAVPTATPGQPNRAEELLRQEIDNLNKQIQEQRRQLESLQNTPPTTSSVQPLAIDPIQDNYTARNRPVFVMANRIPAYSRSGRVGFSPYVGTNFGTATTFNAGVRANYGFDNTTLLFVPEAYIALGDYTGFGISANGVIPFMSRQWRTSPYAGVGVGLHKLGRDVAFATNLIVGVAHQLGVGSVTADYTARGLFDNHQVAMGYRFNF